MSDRSLLLLAGSIGILLGVGSRFADTQENALTWFGSMAAPWVIASFVLGALADTRLRAVVLATGAMVIGVACYYILMRAIEGGVNTGYVRSITAVWLMLSPVAGAVFGLAGAAWRRTDAHWLAPVLAVAATSGTVIGESIFMAVTSRELSTGGIVILGGFVGTASAMPGLLLSNARARLMGYVVAVFVGLVGLAAVPAVRALFAFPG